MRIFTAREQVESLSPWRTASSTSLYRGLEQPYDPNYDTNRSDSATGYSTWTDNPALARQYAGDQGYVYRHDFPSHLQTDSFINDDGDRGLFYNNEKPAGLNGVAGDEYQVYHHHDDYDPSGMTLHEGPRKLSYLRLGLHLAVQEPGPHITYEHRVFPDTDLDTWGGHVVAYDSSKPLSWSPKGTQVGELSWHPTGEIEWAGVNPEYQRQGIGNAMLQRARKIHPGIYHSDDLSDDGAGWSQAVG